MTESEVLKRTRSYIMELLSGEGTGHDWWHIHRVVELAKVIGATEKADPFIVELAALLHDVADWKFHDAPDAGARATRAWLEGLHVTSTVVDEVEFIVANISFKGGLNHVPMRTIEGQVVQDADRMEALGAIGIARAFAFGGSRNRPLYDPRIKPDTFTSIDDVRRNLDNGTTINHFYEKLLKVADLMNTGTGRRLAIDRHEYMEAFLKRFFAEWDGQV